MNARVANEGMSNPKLIDPTPELPDDAQLDNVGAVDADRLGRPRRVRAGIDPKSHQRGPGARQGQGRGNGAASRN